MAKAVSQSPLGLPDILERLSTIFYGVELDLKLVIVTLLNQTGAELTRRLLELRVGLYAYDNYLIVQ